MMHLQGHIDSEKQQNLDLSDLTQCKHCYKQFDTPFEMQTHIEKVKGMVINIKLCECLLKYALCDWACSVVDCVVPSSGVCIA